MQIGRGEAAALDAALLYGRPPATNSTSPD
jgi:hypothetical protein